MLGLCDFSLRLLSCASHLVPIHPRTLPLCAVSPISRFTRCCIPYTLYSVHATFRARYSFCALLFNNAFSTLLPFHSPLIIYTLFLSTCRSFHASCHRLIASYDTCSFHALLLSPRVASSHIISFALHSSYHYSNTTLPTTAATSLGGYLYCAVSCLFHSHPSSQHITLLLCASSPYFILFSTPLLLLASFLAHDITLLHFLLALDSSLLCFPSVQSSS